MDKYDSVRSLPFPALASALGINLKRFKTRKGGEYYGPCPVHGPKSNTTSFSYAADGRFNCFSCSASGRGAIDLTKLVKNLGFKEAVELLGHLPSPQPKKTPVSDSQASSDDSGGELKPLLKDSWRKFAVACPWLEQRIPDAAVRERYGVFCYNNPARRSAYSGRVMLPVKGVDGVLYGYLGRATETSSEPKYLFPKNLPKSKFLFGAHEILAGTFGPAPLKRAYLVESPFCVMKFAMYGLPALSPFGWSVSEEQIALLPALAKGIVYLPDRNKYESSAECLPRIARNLWVRFPPLPEQYSDPESLTLDEILALTK